MFRYLLLIVSLVLIVKCTKMEPFIVGGERAKIEYYAHSAFLNIDTKEGSYVCGSSIINQNVLLSAAHCFEDLTKGSKITISAGSAQKMKGAIRTGSKIRPHPNYDPNRIEKDIALVFVRKAFVLGVYVKKVILMKTPPSSKMAYVAGWGLIDEKNEIDTSWLQHTDQQIWSREECRKILHRIPQGCICGGTKRSSKYASNGDSGSALVVKGPIQIGIVSFKRPEVSRSVVVYTDVGYYYDWIKKAARSLFCSKT